jgi:hypothetical protein
MSTDTVSETVIQPITVKLGGQDYILTPLTLDDLAKAETHLRAQRLNQFLELTRMVEIVNLPDNVRSKAIGEIMNYTITLDEALSSFEGSLYLLYLSLRKATPSLQFGAMRGLEPMLLKTLSDILYRITGLMKPEKEKDDPLEETTMLPTSTEETSIKTFQGGKST